MPARAASLVLAAAALSPAAAEAAAKAGAATPVTETVECVARDERPRRRPGRPAPAEKVCRADGLRPAVWGTLPAVTAVPDRWRIVTTLGYPERLWDPYNGNNVLKGDRPAFGKDWFVALSLISDTTYEGRRIPTPVAIPTSPRPGSLNQIGGPDQTALTENLVTEFVLYKGETVFKPPDYEFRFQPVFNYTRVRAEEAGFLRVDTGAPLTRTDNFVGIQGLFFDKHLRNVSDRYDFDSIRIGIQPITADFRGFLFQDSPFGVRLFGTRDNNRWQYNLAWFRRIEKDTNSGLNDITDNDFGDALREDDVLLFNVYRQDFPVLGFTSQVVLVHNRNRETDEFFVDDNGFVARPAALGGQRLNRYDVTYVGLNGDGHFGRLNLTASLYFAFGTEEQSTFGGLESDIRALFAAAELSRDFDWIRVRATLVFGSGDGDPYDDVSEGYDAIFENPLVAGADTSFWIRQAVPLIGGGRVALSQPNGILNSMRSNKLQGQSNFSNPGVILAGVGADLDLTPKLRLSLNANQLWFEDAATLEAARNQGEIDRPIGQDLSISLFYRPLISQNIILRLSAAALVPGGGYEDLYGSDMPWAAFANVILAY